MSDEARTEADRTLEKAEDELQSLSRTTECEVQAVARAFEGLALDFGPFRLRH